MERRDEHRRRADALRRHQLLDDGARHQHPAERRQSRARGPGLNLGIVRGTIDIPGFGKILNLQLLARALEGDTGANVLSTPNVLTLDNEEARIVVGQNVPFITGSYTPGLRDRHQSVPDDRALRTSASRCA
jgi:type II secretory pathway component GspD/PulD (secretin)